MQMWDTCLVVVLAATATIGTLGCQSKAERGKVEANIIETMKAQKLTLKSVVCPDELPIKQGESFTCKATDSDGTEGELSSTWTEGDKFGIKAGETIAMKSTGDEQEAQLSQQLGSKVDVVCADAILFVKAGKTYTCDATVEAAAGIPHKVDIKISDDKKSITSTLRPASQPAGTAMAAPTPSAAADAPPAAGDAPAADADKPAPGEAEKPAAGDAE